MARARLYASDVLLILDCFASSRKQISRRRVAVDFVSRPISFVLRAVSRHEDTKRPAGSICLKVHLDNRIADRLVPSPVSKALKRQDRIDGSPVAPIDKLPRKTESTVIIEICEDDERPEHSISRIIYRPSSKEASSPQVSHRGDGSLANLVERAATIEEPTAKDLVRRSIDAARKSANYLARFLQYDECSADVQGSSAEHSSSHPCHALETNYDDVRVKMHKESCFSERKSRHVPSRQPKPEVIYRSPPDCEPACPGGAAPKIDLPPIPRAEDSFSRVARRNGLDPTEQTSFYEKKTPVARVCPGSCCRPWIRRSTAGETCVDSSALEIEDRADDQLRGLRRSARTPRTEVARAESAVSVNEEASAYRRSATQACQRARSIPAGFSSSRELLARYEGHVPAYQLERYLACRSKRNGLQDECVQPAALRIAADAREEEQRRILDCWNVKRQRHADEFDRRCESKRTNHDRREISLCLG